MIKIPGLLISAIFFLMSFNATGLDVVRANYNKLVSEKSCAKR